MRSLKVVARVVQLIVPNLPDVLRRMYMVGQARKGIHAYVTVGLN